MSIKQAIICVDDERIVLDSIKAQLRRNFGDAFLYEVAERAEEATEIINELHSKGVKVFLIVSDWLMPGIKGDEFLIQIHKNFPQVVTVMLTGQADEFAVQNARTNADLFACLYKPWSEEDLVKIVKEGLSKR